jgi:hypothetical protein
VVEDEVNQARGKKTPPPTYKYSDTQPGMHGPLTELGDECRVGVQVGCGLDGACRE